MSLISSHVVFSRTSACGVDLPEPLQVECRHFISCIRTGQTPRSGAREGLQVIRVLAAAQRSLEKHGVPVPVE